MEQKLDYISEKRSGYIVYKDRKGEIILFFEYGGGNCIAIIYVPTIKEWLVKTSRPIIDRNSILTFVAEQTIKDQAPNSYYKLEDACIEIVALQSWDPSSRFTIFDRDAREGDVLGGQTTAEMIGKSIPLENKMFIINT